HYRVDRALSAWPDGTHPRIRESEKGDHADQISASAARRYLRRYLWGDDLSGTGNGSCEQTCRLFTCTGRSSPAGHGQKGQGEDGEGESKFYRRLRAHEQDY